MLSRSFRLLLQGSCLDAFTLISSYFRCKDPAWMLSRSFRFNFVARILPGCSHAHFVFCCKDPAWMLSHSFRSNLVARILPACSHAQLVLISSHGSCLDAFTLISSQFRCKDPAWMLSHSIRSNSVARILRGCSHAHFVLNRESPFLFTCQKIAMHDLLGPSFCPVKSVTRHHRHQRASFHFLLQRRGGLSNPHKPSNPSKS